MPRATSCVGVVLLVVRSEEQSLSLLLLRRSSGRFAGQWWPVTGTLNPDEEPLVGALRELAEETQLTPDAVYSTELSGLTENGGRLEVFVAVVGPSARVRLNWEHNAHRCCS